MPRTEAQKRARKKYESKAYDQISFKVAKGKRDEYQQAANRLNLGQAALFRLAAEEFITRYIGGENLSVVETKPLAIVDNKQDKQNLSAEQKRLVDNFNQLPVETQKAISKLVKTLVNQNNPS